MAALAKVNQDIVMCLAVFHLLTNSNSHPVTDLCLTP